ncbi:universal stress protein [Aestuariibacter salexigens]|uniref:universal stress protein n=1 Tax=Aestuariibacter salexigens TaxID=226010 RepID=UPI0004196D74|nr:universal stress protein [Aestuariibacter salexigens]
MSSHYQRVLVALDIYNSYDAVLNKALQIAEDKTQVHLLHVTFPQTSFEPYGLYLERDFTLEITEQAEQKLRDIADKNQLNKDHVYVKVGPAADMIHNTAEAIDADLIVIGTHGKSGMKLLLGSTANAVLHGVNTDVLAVRIKD